MTAVITPRIESGLDPSATRPLSTANRSFTADECERMIAVGILTEDERIELIEGAFVPCARLEVSTALASTD